MDHTAVVTLDVLHNGVMWGWPVAMNLWAKSIATGVVLVAFTQRPRTADWAFYRRWLAPLAFVFMGITLLFTLYDLHQPLRAWHLYVWPHFTSLLNWGGWILNGYFVALLPFAWWWWKDEHEPFDRFFAGLAAIGFVATIYSGGLLGQAAARETWSAPVEMVQMTLSALMCGAGAFLLVGRDRPGDEQDRLGTILAASTALSLLLFGAELWFAPMRSAEAGWIVNELVHGSLATGFLSGLLLAYAVPAVLATVAVRGGQRALLPVAAGVGILGLWLVKYTWLVAPQLLPLS